MNFAVVGCQHFHIRMFIDEMLESGHKFMGIYDDSDYFLPGKYAADYGVKRYISLDELLDDGIDMIGNAVRNDRKVDIIEWAEDHGIHVMTDKPVCICLEELNRLKNVLKRDRIKTGMMLTERYSAPIYTLKEMIRQDVLGEIYDLTFLKPHKLNKSQRPPWFFDRRMNSGLIIDIMIHDFDLISWFTGKKIVQHNSFISKKLKNEYQYFYDDAQVSLMLETAITALLKADWLMPEAFDSWGDGRIFVTGSKGRIEIRTAGDILGDRKHFLTLTTNHAPAKRQEIISSPVGLCEDFIRKIEGKSHILSDEDIINCHEDAINVDSGVTFWNS